MRHFLCAFGSSLICLVLAGCGDGGVAQVSGHVTMDGEPLPNALVTFVPVEGGRAATGRTDENGRYRLSYIDRQGAPIGEHRVAVSTIPETRGMDMSEIGSDDPAYEEQAMGGDPSAYDQATVVEPIPARYNVSTELVEEVTRGSNVINLELTSDP